MWRAKVARVAKGVVLRNLEQKNLTVDLGLTTIWKDGGDVSGNAQPWLSYPLRQISSGTGAVDVIGDEIILKQANFRFLFRNDATSQTVTSFRVMIGWLNPNVTNVGSNWRIGTSGDAITAFIRTPMDQVTIWKKLLHDKSYPVNSILTGVNNMRDVHINLNMHNKKYMFDPVSKAGTHEDLVVMVTASTGSGTPLTTSAGQLDGFYRVWYKDG